MKTEAQIREGIQELQHQTKNPMLPKLAKLKAADAIKILEWVLKDEK